MGFEFFLLPPVIYSPSADLTPLTLCTLILSYFYKSVKNIKSPYVESTKLHTGYKAELPATLLTGFTIISFWGYKVKFNYLNKFHNKNNVNSNIIMLSSLVGSIV